jgi:hypothetical protein
MTIRQCPAGSNIGSPKPTIAPSGEQRYAHEAEDLCPQFPRLYRRITGQGRAAGTARAG